MLVKAVKLGVVFPQTEITEDPGAVREYAQAAEDIGYSHLLVYDHVVGADLRNRPNWRGPYNIGSLFHEPFVLFGYLAGLTRTIELVTGILISPQRQTVLIAKQAAEVDVLTGGRLRLGLGLGWNEVEYTALGEQFTSRGRKLDEQIDLLRALFTQKSVTFRGRFDTVEEAGIKPLPVQQPIPIWLGGGADAAVKRAAVKADGWMPNGPPTDEMAATLARFRAWALEAGRDPDSLGVEARASVGSDSWLDHARRWQALGATHLSINTMGAGLRTPRDHIDAIRDAMERLRSSLDGTQGKA